MSAFEADLNAGVDACKFDVHTTLDGTLVVFMTISLVHNKWSRLS
jgi:hypothetical protein